MLEILRCSIKNIARKKTRSLLIILGIAIGVASVIMIGNTGRSGVAAINYELESLGLGGVSISVSESGKNLAKLTESELNLIRNTENVKQASPIMMQTAHVYRGENKSNIVLWGIDSKAKEIISLKVLYGREINKSDIKASSNVCMVDQNFSKNLYNRENIVGKKVSVLCSGIPENYEVIGVIKTGSGILQNVIGDYIPNFIYIPYTTMQDHNGQKGFDQIAVKVEQGEDVDNIGRSIANNLSRINGISDGYSSNNLSKQKKGLDSLFGIVTLVLSLVGAISLVVASLSIMTMMLVSVNERKREIGIKKALGAGRFIIMMEFLLEALCLSVMGCLAGSAIGIGLFYLGAYIMGVSVKLDISIVFLSILFSISIGTIFGIYPAAKASKLNPAETLRSE